MVFNNSNDNLISQKKDKSSFNVTVTWYHMSINILSIDCATTAYKTRELVYELGTKYQLPNKQFLCCITTIVYQAKNISIYAGTTCLFKTISLDRVTTVT